MIYVLWLPVDYCHYKKELSFLATNALEILKNCTVHILKIKSFKGNEREF